MTSPPKTQLSSSCLRALRVEKDRRGFTLIEMLVASLILAILLAAVTRIATSFTRSPTLTHSADTRAEAIVALVGRDVARSTRLSVGDDGQRIDLDTLSFTTGRPIRVSYLVQNGRLTRAETSRDTSPPQMTAAVVAAGVEKIGVSANAGTMRLELAGPQWNLRRTAVLR